MKSVQFMASFFLLASAFSFALASDPSPLQDFCVAVDEPKNAVFVNGKFCKNPAQVVAEDFFFPGLNIPRDTSNKNGVNVTLLNVDQIAGLNTLGISLARLDYAPNGGLNPPHTHPRATEILVVMQGTLYVGFVTSNPNRLISKVLYPGDVLNLAKTDLILIHLQREVTSAFILKLLLIT
ncbi:germin-like protein subfamily 1 member 13 [Mercurialis annua]|uniref:germin-like protein subfamily 1 member 13 n=1 Tax=Mercurialis annua TaxID=3986 RepID=UPI0024ACDC88|nr:germin-like protein subfamily 1 member 13 [Mercurialis annua]